MKKIILTAVIILMALVFTSESKAEYRQGGFGFFYSSLSPHGSWLELNDGLVVWRPANVRRTWAPYTNGQWIWTNDGWYWDSYEDYGYITYHYGRWYNDNYYGWIWVPDYEWAPSWVEWRYDDDYIGWAPLPPYAIFSINVGIHNSYEYNTPYHHWHFVKYGHFCDPYVNKYYVSTVNSRKIFSNTRYRTNYGYEGDRVVNRGVDVDIVRKRSGRDINERNIERVSDPGQVRNSGGRNSNDRVRTFVATEDQFNRDSKDVKITRADRNSSLQTSKVEIGKRNTEQRTSTRDIERTKNDSAPREKSRSAETIKTDNKRSTENVRTEQTRTKENVRTNESTRVKENTRTKEQTRSTERTKEQPRSTERKKETPRIERKTNSPMSDRMETREVPVKRGPTSGSSTVETNQDRNVATPRQERTTTRTQQPVRETKVEQKETRSSTPARVERQSTSERQTERTSENRNSGRTR